MIPEREAQDDEARRLITTMMVKGYPIITNSDLYKKAYDRLQSSENLRRELQYLEGLPPCPQPSATTTVTTVGPAPQIAPIGGWTSSTPVSPPPAPPAGQNQVYNPFYYTPGTSPPVYNTPFYNAPLVPPPPPVATVFNTPVYNALWEGGGFYFGPTGSLSALRDSDIIKRLEARTIDSLSSMPRSITGTSASWISSSDSWLRSSDSFRLGGEGSKTKLLTSSLGYDVGARAGYQWGNFRGEFQFDYANNSVDTFGNPRRTSDFVMRERSVSGSTTGMTFLINGFLDVNVPYLNAFGATPYFGGGIGGGQTSLDLKVRNRTIVNDSDWGLAYQLGAGVRWQIMPGWSLDVGYRYKGITDVTLHNEFEKIIVPNRSHNFEASFLYQLPPLWGATRPATPYIPPPLPAPPPPPPPA